MPENEFPKIKTHPGKRAPPTPAPQADAPAPRQLSPIPYAELAVTSNYSFLTGASHPEEMVEYAAAAGHHAAAITDVNTLAGIVRAHVAAKDAGGGIPLAVGCRLRLIEPVLDILVYPTSRPAYARLCRLLTLGKRRAAKGQCLLTLRDLPEYAEGLLAIAIPPEHPGEEFDAHLQSLKAIFNDDRLSLAACRRYATDDADRIPQLAALAEQHAIPLVAINDAHYHAPERRPLQDVLTCIRHGCTIHEAGLRLHANAERYLKPADEMARLFAQYPKAIARTMQIARRAAAFSLDQIKYEYPTEPCPDGLTPYQYLVDRTWAGAAKRYPSGVPDKVRSSLLHELALIEELHYEPYFLTCFDIVSFARSKDILCQGRGGAANSAVCYCLGITEVDPARFSLLFERFISRARAEPPDIDIDFEHERREEVIQYLYAKYGRERAALTAEVITYRGRSAVRDVGKAMGLSLDAVDQMARNLDRWYSNPNPDHIREAGFNPDDPTIAQVMHLTRELVGFPRHLSQHVGGFVITRTPLSELVPIENAAMDDRTVIEWDKDDIDAMGMLKVDVLGLGMLTCLRKCLVMLGHGPTFTKIPLEDPETYKMIQRADTVGVFQIESRAQMSMLPRLKPENFYDLVIEVAIVRPGPIQGGMVHPYLRRRNKEEPVSYPSPDVEAVLKRTLGVPLFQEQAMQLAIVAAGFTPDEADGLRRAMASWRRKGDKMARFGEKLVAGMIARGYPPDFAARCFEQIKGFSEYGFPESHAASFALLVYHSCWLKRHHPAAFAAALINSQPMGFYQPAQIIRDAKEHAVEIRPIDVNHSNWDCTLEPQSPSHLPPTHEFAFGASGPALRIGMRLVKALRQHDAKRISDARAIHGRFQSIEHLWRTSNVSVAGLRTLAQADAFGSMNLDRQGALWRIKPLRDESLPLFDRPPALAQTTELQTDDGLDVLPSIDLRRRVLYDYERTGLSLKAHPVSFLRPHLDSRQVTPTDQLRSDRLCPQGRIVTVAGLVLVRQRPGTASGVVFITLEDETGIANLIIWSDTFERYRKVARLSTLLLARGRIERQGEVVHLHTTHMECLDEQMEELASASRDFH